MKLSEIDVPFVKEYLRQDGDEDDKLIGAILEGAKDCIVKYIGQSLEQLEESEDLTIAVLVLCAEFYDNRTISVNDRLNLRINIMLESLIGRYSCNLIQVYVNFYVAYLLTENFKCFIIYLIFYIRLCIFAYIVKKQEVEMADTLKNL